MGGSAHGGEIASNIMEKIFPADQLIKRERVEATLNHQSVDRVALHDQLSFNPGVLELYTGKRICGFDYTLEDIGQAIMCTLDMCFPPHAPVGTQRVEQDGWVRQNDNWTSWLVKRPFTDVAGARSWLAGQIKALRSPAPNAQQVRADYRQRALELQRLVGETVVCQYPVDLGLCSVYSDSGMGLELFSYFYQDFPEMLDEYQALYWDRGVETIHAIADSKLSPVILIAEDFATKQGPIFGEQFLQRHLYPGLRRYTKAWQEHEIKVLYHSDGNYRKALPDLIACGVEGFYCLEPNCGMDIVELKNKWPAMAWAGGVDGVDLLERGTPTQVRAEVHRHIRETNALHTGGMFVGSSSEINPPITPENFKAMVAAVGELRLSGNLKKR